MANIAFLGTGLLGSGMVEHFLRVGERVTVWNRTAAKAHALEALGARAAASPEEAIELIMKLMDGRQRRVRRTRQDTDGYLPT